ncbi:hypothetical protein TNIN_407331 [Trichonephila inaurata madagascariensis]|uniref:Uncharacterized protein n=1 Tax=Trichonephila inaurata madagascariensis TaxID=2747483 RepID=A0A8X6I4W8_9ARAC|nr:hypothetical protein TNIN_407331 [Trichonephila inaurata madagascariensis]
MDAAHEIGESGLHQRRDGVSPHRFLSTLWNESLSKMNEMLFFNGKHFAANRDKAVALAKHYAYVCKLPRNTPMGPNFPGTPVGCLNQIDDDKYDMTNMMI